QVSWTAYDNGINLVLEYQEDLHFTSKGIVVVPLTETTPEETEAPTEEPTEAPTEEPTEEPTEAPTDAATDAPATDAPATEQETEAEGGCGSVIGFSAIAVLAAAAAAVALKKD
ncbi:MAG: PT domain-containing protein, partial [Clostridia bacterium]|nr:PT domain-containing protein [Clostridia bacterium]